MAWRPSHRAGLTDDERIKPDLVAPGTNISRTTRMYRAPARSGSTYAANPHYVFSGGTSMATAARGWCGCAGTRVAYRAGGLLNPSAAAVKATLLNTTMDIAPGQYGAGEKREIPFVRPNGVVTAGAEARPGLYRSARALSAVARRPHRPGWQRAQTLRYTNTLGQPLAVSSGGQPLRVMLAWTDPPARVSLGKAAGQRPRPVVKGPDGRGLLGQRRRKRRPHQITWKGHHRRSGAWRLHNRGAGAQRADRHAALRAGGRRRAHIDRAAGHRDAHRHHDQPPHRLARPPPQRPARRPGRRRYRRQYRRSGRFTSRSRCGDKSLSTELDGISFSYWRERGWE